MPQQKTQPEGLRYRDRQQQQQQQQKLLHQQQQQQQQRQLQQQQQQQQQHQQQQLRKLLLQAEQLLQRIAVHDSDGKQRQKGPVVSLMSSTPELSPSSSSSSSKGNSSSNNTSSSDSSSCSCSSCSRSSSGGSCSCSSSSSKSSPLRVEDYSECNEGTPAAAAAAAAPSPQNVAAGGTAAAAAAAAAENTAWVEERAAAAGAAGVDLLAVAFELQQDTSLPLEKRQAAAQRAVAAALEQQQQRFRGRSRKGRLLWAAGRLFRGDSHFLFGVPIFCLLSLCLCTETLLYVFVLLLSRLLEMSFFRLHSAATRFKRRQQQQRQQQQQQQQQQRQQEGGELRAGFSAGAGDTAAKAAEGAAAAAAAVAAAGVASAATAAAATAAAATAATAAATAEGTAAATATATAAVPTGWLRMGRYVHAAGRLLLLLLLHPVRLLLQLLQQIRGSSSNSKMSPCMLKRQLEKCRSFAAFAAAAAELDAATGRDSWKLKRETSLFDWKETQQMLLLLTAAREKKDPLALAAAAAEALRGCAQAATQEALYSS
ncbi:hypothetical protein, conserved [Eimeria acervulina]|uniref:Triacylglycerol lipase N-terminal domain-containing protein n=1 Tax=Eimeria acervulina TaxID=5801 RepID=U6GLI1_EIMAC|nr:hypothetical protein, conserved [Eimeria acervulina]CDI79469.1 hypothetical protein, conserved [Eimeria acervulina]